MSKLEEEERVSRLFYLMMSLFEQFVDNAKSDIIDPFFEGDVELANENLHKISKNITIDKLLTLALKNFEDLISLRIGINKHYGDIVSVEKEQEIDAKLHSLGLMEEYEELRKSFQSESSDK